MEGNSAMGISVVSTRCGSAKLLLIGAVLFFNGLIASH